MHSLPNFLSYDIGSEADNFPTEVSLTNCTVQSGGVYLIVLFTEQEAFKKRVDEVNELFSKYCTEKNWDALKTLFCQDAVEMPPFHDFITGNSGLCKYNFSCTLLCSRHALIAAILQPSGVTCC